MGEIMLGRKRKMTSAVINYLTDNVKRAFNDKLLRFCLNEKLRDSFLTKSVAISHS